MIIQKCDICEEVVNNLYQIIVYKQPIDYCDKCRKPVEKMLMEFKKEVNFENSLLDTNLKHKETRYINKLKKGVQKI